MPATLTPVTLVVRKVKSISNSIDEIVPIDALRNYFKAWNIDLQFVAGAPIDKEPSQIQFLVDKLLRDHRQAHPAPTPGLLVVGLKFRNDSGTNGMLLDVDARGACEIFTMSDAFRFGTADQQFQIFVHEIGHILNLTHDDSSEDFPSAMDQWDRRENATDRHAIWNRCKAAADPALRSRIAGLLQQSGGKAPGLPLAPASATFFKQAQEADLKPWGGPFRDDAEGAHADVRYPGLTISVELDRQKVGLGEPLDLAVRLTLAEDADPIPMKWPLGLKYRTLAIRILPPSGREHHYRSRTLACGDTLHVLEPGTSLVKHCALLFDTVKVLFDEVGPHRITVSVPALGVIGKTVDIDVLPPAAPALASKAFQRFLVEGLPETRKRQWGTLNRLIADDTIPVALRSHLAELRLTKRPHSDRHAESLGQMNQDLIPARVKERVALVNVGRAIQQFRDQTMQLQEEIEKARQLLGPSAHLLASLELPKTSFDLFELVEKK